MLRTIRLRDAKALKKTVEAALELLFDDFSDVSVPSAPTMSRARRKIDLAIMFMRRQELAERGLEDCSVQLSPRLSCQRQHSPASCGKRCHCHCHTVTLITCSRL
jgi:hypothetical protein